MGTSIEINLSDYGCTCFNQEDKNYLDFFEEIKTKPDPLLNSILSEENKNKNKTNENSTLQTTNKKYEKIVHVPNNTNTSEKENSLLNPLVDKEDYNIIESILSSIDKKNS